jgi:exoribonuclease R
MSRIIKFSAERDWYAANWAAEHLARLILRFLPAGSSDTLRRQLESIEAMGFDLDLSGSSSSDIQTLLAASERAFDALTKAGPDSELFADAEFYSASVDRFREFTDTLRRDERVTKSA